MRNSRRNPVTAIISTLVTLLLLTLMGSITHQSGVAPAVWRAVGDSWVEEDPALPDPVKVKRQPEEQAKATAKELQPSASPDRSVKVPAAGVSSMTDRQVARAVRRVKALPVKGRASSKGYDRDQFGAAWSDAAGDFYWTRNGCDTRNDALKRDLVRVVFKAGTRDCKVLSGVLRVDPYSGERHVYQVGGGYDYELDAEHVVALGNAWVTGAFKWSADKRAAFANDPLVVMMVDPSLNRQKGDADAASWLPPNKSYRCVYVARQSRIKAKYGLWVTPAEKSAMLRVLGRCS